MTNQSEDRSRESSRRLLQITEHEVGRIILDIHDGPVQNIFAALSQLNIVHRNLSRMCGEEASQDIDRIQQTIGILEHSLNEVRAFMGTFRPPEFERRSLVSVLDGLAILHEEMTENPVTMDVKGSLPDVSLHVKIGLYRVLQEALSNSSRHAQVDRHKVFLMSDDTSIVMEVSDNGKGFDVDTALAQEGGVHIGLAGMRDRVEILGGTIDIQSKPGTGTTVRVVVPCQ